MRKEKANRPAIAAVCWLLAAVCMGVIFWLSSRTADESSAQSGAVLDFLLAVFGDTLFTTFLVRKAAHCLEFAGLSFLFHLSFYTTWGKPKYLYPIALTSLYAVTDEVHQIFVPGRSCQISDWAIDTGGALLGALGFFVLFSLAAAVRKRKNPVDREQNSFIIDSSYKNF